MTEYTINKKFTTHVQRSDRVLECVEAFGIGLDDREFVIYDNFKAEVFPGDIVYITGQSGSGKSLLLRELDAQMRDEGMVVANIDDVQVDERPLIDQVGTDTSEALKILSLAGLNDAYLFIRSPQELSDGQLYRFKMAKLMESDANVWVADEFGAVLDRTTAKLVALNLQKFARRKGATVIVATTHKDLRQDLAPNLYIDKRFQDKLEIDYERQKEIQGECYP